MASSGAEAFVALGVEGEIHHHDGVLLHDAHEENDADEGNERKDRCPQIMSASSAPTPADGRVERMVMGWIRLS